MGQQKFQLLASYYACLMSQHKEQARPVGVLNRNILFWHEGYILLHTRQYSLPVNSIPICSRFYRIFLNIESKTLMYLDIIEPLNLHEFYRQPFQRETTGDRLNIKMLSYQYRNSLFRVIMKKAPKFRITDPQWGKSIGDLWTVNSTGQRWSPHKGPVMRKTFPCCVNFIIWGMPMWHVTFIL